MGVSGKEAIENFIIYYFGIIDYVLLFIIFILFSHR